MHCLQLCYISVLIFEFKIRENQLNSAWRAFAFMFAAGGCFVYEENILGLERQWHCQSFGGKKKSSVAYSTFLKQEKARNPGKGCRRQEKRSFWEP